MTGSLRAIVVLAVGVGAVVIALGLRPRDETLQTVQSTTTNPEAPAMCPWREPQRDMQAFFPGSDGYQTQTVALSRKRLQIIKRLGPGAALDSNALYINRITKQGETIGAVIVKRAAGEFGGIEIVLAVHQDGHIAGVHIQRHREPPSVAEVIASANWLGSFTGKSADAPFSIGQDIPVVPAPARTSASAVVSAIKMLMIEYDESREAVVVPHH